MGTRYCLFSCFSSAKAMLLLFYLSEVPCYRANAEDSVKLYVIFDMLNKFNWTFPCFRLLKYV